MTPNWIIIGAPKAGTSSLFQWLADHPQVGGSKEKETYYFVDPGTHMHRATRSFAHQGLAGYEALFAHCDPSVRVVMEATPGYLYSETALRELPRLPSHPHFIVVLREPVAQLRSLHRYFQQNWNWIPRDMSFSGFVEAVDRGTGTFRGNELASAALENARYVDHLRRWREACGPERLHLFLFEDLVANPKRFMAELAGRMGIDPDFYETYAFPSENETYVVRSGALQELNIRLRALLPQGRFYNLLRRAYRAANTRPASRSGNVDSLVERKLSQRYLPMIAELEQDFGLDLSRWRGVMERRIAGGDGDGADRPASLPRPSAAMGDPGLGPL